jgi:hypothetical protein
MYEKARTILNAAYREGLSSGSHEKCLLTIPMELTALKSGMGLLKV